jgi:hypothetical protein
MAKRIKKPPVPPEKRRDWLRRKEEYGETVPQIAEKDNYDERTVRKHLDIASRERDQKQARISFVKDNMEKHHQDLCNLAENLLSQVTAERVLDLDFSENMYLEAMRQHLSRTPLWNKIKSWNNTLSIIEKIKGDVRNRLEKSLKKTELNRILSDEAEGVMKTAVDALAHQFEQWSHGGSGLDINRDWIIEDRKDVKISVRYGFSHFGRIRESELATIKRVIGRYEKLIRKWREHQEMEKQVKDLKELGKFIRIELRGIIIRRVLPGSCAYCPI